MTTYVAFAPATTGPPFTFQATLDGSSYVVATAWNVAAQRWYVSITDQFGNLVVNRPMLGSPAQVALSALSWANGLVTATAPSYLGYRLGSAPMLSIAGAAPAALNGTLKCAVIGPMTFVYPLAADPGQVTAFGSYSADCDLAWGYFQTSALVWRASTGNFEITP